MQEPKLWVTRARFTLLNALGVRMVPFPSPQPSPRGEGATSPVFDQSERVPHHVARRKFPPRPEPGGVRPSPGAARSDDQAAKDVPRLSSVPAFLRPRTDALRFRGSKRENLFRRIRSQGQGRGDGKEMLRSLSACYCTTDGAAPNGCFGLRSITPVANKAINIIAKLSELA
jgi:hypothetical protein